MCQKTTTLIADHMSIGERHNVLYREMGGAVFWGGSSGHYHRVCSGACGNDPTPTDGRREYFRPFSRPPRLRDASSSGLGGQGVCRAGNDKGREKRRRSERGRQERAAGCGGIRATADYLRAGRWGRRLTRPRRAGKHGPAPGGPRQ